MDDRGKLGILVGGGPAPGINSVIGAATIRSRLAGMEVVGIRDGFSWIMQGRTDHAHALRIRDVSRVHFRGGSILGISRANPTTDVALLDRTVATLTELGVTKLITIGGDDTAYSALCLQERAVGRIRVAHVPKTIDNDLDLPPNIDTFGFQTARHVGAQIVSNLMLDAYTTGRWYLAVTMGRKAGHLALGIGKSAGATLTLIPEEFSGGDVPLEVVADTLAGAVVKRLHHGRGHGVAVIAEGVALKVDAGASMDLDDVERDDHGHVRLSEVDFGRLLQKAVERRLQELGVEMTIVPKNIGYELRCADPIPVDMEYTRDLGYCAAQYLLEGGNAAMVSIQAGNFVPVPFSEMIDPSTKRTAVRLVDTTSAHYRIARRYMIRLARDDFEDAEETAKLAAVAGLTPEQFRERFAYLVADEPPALHFGRAAQ